MSDVPLVAQPRSTEPRAIARELLEAFGGSPGVVLYFASSELDFPVLAREITEVFAGSLVVGCTTCGEIGPDGCTTGRVSAFAFGLPVKARAVLFDRMIDLKFDRAVGEVEALVRSMTETSERVRSPVEHFVFVSLTCGLAGAEELLLTAIARAAPGIALAGGSAGDDFHFTGTWVAVGDRARRGGGVLVLLDPQREFKPFHVNHYVRESKAMVVTEADPSRRRVSRIDGYPAVEALVRAGLDEAMVRAYPRPDQPSPIGFGFVAGPSIFMRGVMTVVGDDLMLGGSLEEGTVIYLVRPGDLVDETRRGIEAALRTVEQPAGLLLFNCGGRIWEAVEQGRVADLARAMLPIPGAGFTTYGEQFRAVHLNHTLTGLVFGQST